MKGSKVNDFIDLRPSPRGGFGMYARKNISPQTVILKEEPFIIASSEDEIMACYASLHPQQQREFNSLHWWWERNSNPILGRFKTNEFGLDTGGTARRGAVAFMVSRFNHDCDPSARVVWEWEKPDDRGRGYLRVDVSREIVKGEEITICYTTETYRLYHDYGFECICTCHGGVSNCRSKGQLTPPPPCFPPP